MFTLKVKLWRAILAALPIAAAAQAPAPPAAPLPAPALRWQVVARYPHNPRDFTQGLVYANGKLFESTGQYGQSTVTKKDLLTGSVIATTALPAKEFGEGLALCGKTLLQLTWREGIAHRYSLGLKPRGNTHYSGEGWGLACHGEHIWRSNGSATLQQLSAATLEPVASIVVSDNGKPIRQLNELEYAQGALYANIWYHAQVARINPATGAVTGWLDFAPLVSLAGIDPQAWQDGAVLNGLAYRPDNGHLLVTGKYWPAIFEVAVEGLGPATTADTSQSAH